MLTEEVNVGWWVSVRPAAQLTAPQCHVTDSAASANYSAYLHRRPPAPSLPDITTPSGATGSLEQQPAHKELALDLSETKSPPRVSFAPPAHAATTLPLRPPAPLSPSRPHSGPGKQHSSPLNRSHLAQEWGNKEQGVETAQVQLHGKEQAQDAAQRRSDPHVPLWQLVVAQRFQTQKQQQQEADPCEDLGLDAGMKLDSLLQASRAQSMIMPQGETRRLFRGLRIKGGIDQGAVASCIEASTARVMLHGAALNRASRISELAKTGHGALT